MNAPIPNRFAIEAASLVLGKLAIPDFGPARMSDQTDFNDLAQSQGPEAVSRSINSAQFVILESSNVGEKTAPNHESKVNLIRGSDLTTMSTTILDRLMHRCTMLEFEGRSYRLKEAAARLTREAANTP